MKRSKSPIASRSSIWAPALACSLLIAMLGFAITYSSGNPQAVVSVQAAGRGRPWINLQDSRDLKSDYAGTSDSSLALQADAAQPLSVTTDDFDVDGFPDLVIGSVTPVGGAITLHWGSKQAFAPRDQETLAAITQNQFPDPFLKEAATFPLPEAPDILTAGDFDRDGNQDVIAVARGSKSLYLLRGDGLGSLLPAEPVAMPGSVTAMETGDINQRDGAADLIVAVSGAEGPELLVYDSRANLFSTSPLVVSLPAEATSLAVGRLDDDPFLDLAILANGQLLALHGYDSTADDQSQRLRPDLETIDVALPFKTMTLGDFIWDRDGRPEIAALSYDGTVSILARGELNTRPFTASEMQDIRQKDAKERLRIARQKKFATPRSTERLPWKIVETLPGSAPVAAQALTAGGAAPQEPMLIAARMSTLPSDDLLVMDGASRSLQMFFTEPSQLSGDKTASLSIARGSASLDALNDLVGVLPMRLSVLGQPGLVVLTRNHPTASLIVPQAATTITVNDSSDTLHNAAGQCALTGTGTCSLRDAIIFSNTNVGADTINIQAGLATITLSRLGNDATATNGDLDINDSVTINGNNNTVSAIGGFGDKIFGVNQDGTFPNLVVSINNLTIQNGSNTIAASDPLFAFTGGGFDIFLSGASSNTTLTNCTLTNNSDAHGYGGGLNVDSSSAIGGTGAAQGSVTLTGCTISNNSTLSSAAGEPSPGAGINLFSNNHNVTMTDCVISGNTISGQWDGGGVSIRHSFGGTILMHGCAFSNNTAGSRGGGVVVESDGINVQAVTIDKSASNLSSLTGNTTGANAGGVAEGGGFYVTARNTFTNSLSKVNITGNKLDTVSASTKTGGGGIGVGDIGTSPLTIQFCRIVSNTLAGAATGKGLRKEASAGTVTASSNWWGCNNNDNPSTGPCNAVVTTAPGVVNITPWWRLTHTASPSVICPNTATTLTASFLSDSNGNPVSVANLDVLLGRAITFNNAILGALSGAQATIQATGTATVTYTSGGTGGNGHADAIVDTGTTTADILVLIPPSISKAFASPHIPVNGITTLTFTITNSNAVNLTSVNFSDTLPAGLEVAPTPNVTNTCGGTVTATAGTGTISLTGSTITANSSCTISVDVKGTTEGVKNNTSGTVTGSGCPGNTASASVTVIDPPTIAKAFNQTTIPAGGVATLTFTLTNPNQTQSITGVSFTDTLPAGLVVADTPNVVNNCGGGTVTATAGTGSISLSALTLTANQTCSISVDVKGTAGGDKNNSVTVDSTNAGTGNTSNATINVVEPPSISKAFSPTSIQVGGISTLTFTITNPAANTVALAGVSFTDTLPAGVQVAATPNVTNSCSGTVTAVAGSGTITLASGSIAIAGSCTISVDVTGTTAGDKLNSVAASSTNGGTGNTANATLNVVAPPSIAKAFNPTTIPLNGTSTLTFTITNPAGNTIALTGVSFTDTLPAGVEVAATPNVTGVCAGTVTAVAGAGTISLVGGSVAASGSCTISVDVTGTTSGIKNNSVTVSSTNGGTGNTANAMLTVAAPPSISKAFSPTSIPVGGVSTLIFTINNPNTNVALTGVSFTDNLPAGVEVAATPNVTGACGGSVTATAGTGVISLTGGSIAASGSCMISVDVTGTTAGVKNNSVTVSSTEGGTGNTANATLTVVAPPTISKAFNPTSIPVGGVSTLTFTINNPNTTAALTGVSFTDNLPAGVEVAATPNVVGVCSGTVTAPAGAGVISLSGGSIAASGSCTISVDVTATTAGAKNNSVTVDSTNGGTGNTANATLTVVAPPSIAKAFNPTVIALNGVSTLTFTITNPNAAVALTGVAFTDNLPAGVSVANPANVSGACSGTVTATSGTGTISLTGGSIAGGGSCVISVDVVGTTSGLKNNSVTVTSTNGGTGNTANATLTVASPPTLAKAFGDACIPVNGKTTITFTIANPNTINLTGVGFSDNLPAGMQVANPANAGSTCVGGTITAVPGSASITVSGITVTASSSCTITVDVTSTNTGVSMNTTGSISSTEGGTGATSNTASITIAPPPTITCPPDKTANADANCQALVDVGTATGSSTCSVVTVTATRSDNKPLTDPFRFGQTDIIWTATDSANNMTTCTQTVTVVDTTPPVIVCPGTVTINSADPNQPTVIVNYPPPTVSDNCLLGTVACNPPSGSSFPRGTTTVTCTATDGSNNMSSCSFLVTIFDMFIQDDSNPAVGLLFDSITGNYVFCCAGTKFVGKGTITKSGSIIALTDNKPDRRLVAKVDLAKKQATAQLQSPPGVVKCTLTDRNITNNSDPCP
jgi:uncharacterized repeat protein (TIGR01451 family)